MKILRFTSLLCLCAGDFLTTLLGSDLIIYIVLFIVTVDLFSFIVRRSFPKLLLVLILAYTLALLSIPFWATTYTLFAYLGLVVPFWIYYRIGLTQVSYWFLLILFANLVLGAYEYFSKSYVYEGNASRLGETVELSFREISGNVMRAKGLFLGPLTLSNFALGLAFVFYDRKEFVVGSILIAILSNSRLALIVSGLLLLLNTKNLKNIVHIVVLSSIIVATMHGVVDDAGIERIMEVSNLNSNNHVARFFYMFSGLQHWWNYNVLHKLLGNSGSLLLSVGNNAENGWITLLCEFGILGFIFYLFLPVKLLLNFFSKTKIKRASIVLLLVLVMSAQTYYLSLIGPLVFWLPLIRMYEEID